MVPQRLSLYLNTLLQHFLEFSCQIRNEVVLRREWGHDDVPQHKQVLFAFQPKSSLELVRTIAIVFLLMKS